jgi:hypothetical protein
MLAREPMPAARRVDEGACPSTIDGRVLGWSQEEVDGGQRAFAVGVSISHSGRLTGASACE